MKTLKEYELQLKSLPKGEHVFSYHLDDKFFATMESADIKGGSIDAEVVVVATADAYELTFSVVGEVTVECDRCLDDMSCPVDAEYHTFVRFGSEYDDSTDDLLIIPESDNGLDVSRLLYDTVALALPLQHVHDEGECNEEMSEILRRHSGAMPADSDGEAMVDPRWEALKKFKNN